ncbi:ISAon1 family transposase N-terminal region protein [Elizabethkingia ursingii]|uniref:Transposase n=1 Tax=Elizabethkingia ursingii TaxID=1756150 RepID=A0ABX3N8E1_9FLAO|nr:transposase [Elizabethkingia ursingii]OPB88539.1 transposase [Elizabethkingia ursingii]
MLNETEILKLLLPEVLIDYFDVTKIEEVEKALHIYFEEKNSIPKEFESRILQSKGFSAEIIVEDFPLRGRSVKLHIKRRRWTDIKSKQILQRDWALIAKGTRMTHEFAEFLKKISRY